MASILRNIQVIRNYDIISICRLVLDIILTKVLFGSKFRRIKNPYYISGKKYIDFGTGFSSGINLRIEVLPAFSLRVKKVSLSKNNSPTLCFGNYVQLNDNVHIACVESVKIGNEVLIGSNVLITDHNHGRYSVQFSEQDSPLIPPNKRPLSSSPVIINDNVWIGDFVSILPGTEIGAGAIIGTQSVVTSDIPPYSIAVGCPAKVVKRFNFDSNQWVKA
jgi:acetyltransferase-like isoleucine patch superfamily enzyme